MSNPAARLASSIHRCTAAVLAFSGAPRALPSVEPEKPPTAHKDGRRLGGIADVAVLEADDARGNKLYSAESAP
jgi:hypothetical protein